LRASLGRLPADILQHLPVPRRFRAFLRRFPQAATTLELPDFTLYRLELLGGRMVLGFGRALNLSASHFHDLRKAGNEDAV
jgi:hypothetical protein